MTLCVSTVIASEFMPVSLLTPIAADLHLTEGQAWQAISLSGLFAVLTSLFVASAARGLDRRALLLGLTALMLVSGLVVTLAPNDATLMVGRALLGVVIGGFWSMMAATVMRLVPARDVPCGLAIMNGGNALATTVAAPLGSFFGQDLVWHGAFFSVVPIAAATLAWQYFTLPAMPVQDRAGALAAFAVLRSPQVPLGMLSVGSMAETQEMLDFCGRKTILPDGEMIRMDEVNLAFERLEKADVRYRFVIDMASLTA